MQALISYQATNEARMNKLEATLDRLTELAMKQDNTNQQMHATIRSLENSVTQISKELKQRNPKKFPSTSEPNPKNQCNAINSSESNKDKEV